MAIILKQGETFETMVQKTCHLCAKVSGCPQLKRADGGFDSDKVITRERFRPCAEFQTLGKREQSVREALYSRSGLGYLRALFELPETLMNDLREGERNELMHANLPDFDSPPLLFNGMTESQREEVLRYETDDQGNIIVEVDKEGVEHKLARSTLVLRHYASLEDGHVQLPPM